MATKACKLLCLVIFSAFIIQGYGCQGELKDIIVKQSQTGNMVQNKPEWEVRVTNPCTCTLLDARLSCVDFQSIIPIDSSVLSKSGDVCFLNSGGPTRDVSFKYVWDHSFDLKIIEGQFACS